MVVAGPRRPPRHARPWCVWVQARAGRSGRRDSTTSPSAIRLCSARSRWTGSAQACSSRGAGHAALGVAQHRHQPAADHPVGAGPGLAAARRSVVRRSAGEVPGAPVLDRAGGAATGSRPCTPARRAPSPPPPRWPAARRGPATRRACRSALVTAVAGNSTPPTARANTRRTLVSSTAWLPPKANDAIALAV